jgi:hypothetical protein
MPNFKGAKGYRETDEALWALSASNPNGKKTVAVPNEAVVCSSADQKKR